MRVKVQILEPFDLIVGRSDPVWLKGEALLDEIADEVTIELDPGSMLGEHPVQRLTASPRYGGDQVGDLLLGKRLIVNGAAEATDKGKRGALVGFIGGASMETVET